MRRSTDRWAAWLVALAAAGVLAAGVLAAAPAAAGAQEVRGTLFERLNLDRLRLTALGGSVGALKPTQMDATEAYSLHADYGEIAPRWRVVFTATYWGSRLNDETMNRFADTLRKAIVDPSGDDTLDVGEVSVQDITLGAELRWSPRWRGGNVLRPYLGGGVGAHVLNAEGRAIRGTFAERALDDIAAGLAATAGLDVVFFGRVGVGMQARYDLLSGARFGSLRAVGNYLLRPARPGNR